MFRCTVPTLTRIKDEWNATHTERKKTQEQEKNKMRGIPLILTQFPSTPDVACASMTPHHTPSQTHLPLASVTIILLLGSPSIIQHYPSEGHLASPACLLLPDQQCFCCLLNESFILPFTAVSFLGLSPPSPFSHCHLPTSASFLFCFLLWGWVGSLYRHLFALTEELDIG